MPDLWRLWLRSLRMRPKKSPSIPGHIVPPADFWPMHFGRGLLGGHWTNSRTLVLPADMPPGGGLEGETWSLWLVSHQESLESMWLLLRKKRRADWLVAKLGDCDFVFRREKTYCSPWGLLHSKKNHDWATTTTTITTTHSPPLPRLGPRGLENVRPSPLCSQRDKKKFPGRMF